MCKSLVTKKTTHDSQVSIHWLPGGFTDVHGCRPDRCTCTVLAKPKGAIGVKDACDCTCGFGGAHLEQERNIMKHACAQSSRAMQC